MKFFLIIVVLVLVQPALAIQWQIFGACKNTPVQEGNFTADLNKSLGVLSEEIFQQENIAYVGSAEGFNSILNYPIGLDSIEVVSDQEMRVYGWCYSLNGKSPDLMPHQIQLTSQKDKIIWYYAYSTNKNNTWTDYCSPAYWIKAIQFCGR